MNIISLESYFKNIIKTLVREDVVSITDFNWLKFLHIKLDGENCNIRIFNMEMEYGYEYVGLQNNFIVSPVTERMIISLANCVDDKKPFIIYGLPESGKKETLISFSKILGKSIFIFKCSQNFDQKSFHKLLYGGQKAGNWLLLDNIENISKENLSAIAQDILIVHWNIQDPKADFYLPYDKIPINKNTRIICTTRLHKISNINILSENTKYSFRFIGQSVPDLYFMINSSLKNLGFPKCKLYTRKIKYLLEYLNIKISLLKYKRIGMNLFKKLLKRLEREVFRVNSENADNSVRRALEKIFVPFMTDDENEDMMVFYSIIIFFIIKKIS
jgi:dynein heavy chain